MSAHDPPIVSAAASCPEDAALLERLRAGDDHAFESFVRGAIEPMLAVARRITRTEQDAEDAVQEAFLAAFRGIASFEGRSTLHTWLHRIVVNAALAATRRRDRRCERSIEALLPRFDAEGEHVDHPRDWATGMDDRLVACDRRGDVRNAVDELPEDFRAVILLRDVADLPTSAVAITLEISEALVRQRLHRGRQALLTLLRTPSAS